MWKKSKLRPSFSGRTIFGFNASIAQIVEIQQNVKSIPDLAAFFDALIRAEHAAGGSRERGIRAARDQFYRGEPAERIEAFLREPVRDASGRAHAGLLTAQDLADYEGAIEEPVRVDYRGATVFKCPPWSQGPVFLQQLRLLEGFELADMGRGSADALHTWIECAKLAFADREASTVGEGGGLPVSLRGNQC